MRMCSQTQLINAAEYPGVTVLQFKIYSVQLPGPRHLSEGVAMGAWLSGFTGGVVDALAGCYDGGWRATRLTEFDEGVRPGNSLYLGPIQVDELTVELIQVLVGQLLGVALLCQRQVAHICVYHVVEYKVAAVNRHPAVVRLLHRHLLEQCLQNEGRCWEWKVSAAVLHRCIMGHICTDLNHAKQKY